MDYSFFLFFGSLGLFLFIFNTLKQKRPVAYWESPLDRVVPFVPACIVLYFLYFPFIFATFVALHGTLYEIGFIAATNLALYSSLLVYYFFPSSIHHPALPEKGRRNFFESVMELTYRVDQTTNGFPSAHVYVSVICGYYLVLAFPAYAIAAAVAASAIALSTVLVKQHYVIDLFGGILWAFGAIAITSLIL